MIEFETYFRFVLALIFVIGMICLLAWGAKRFGLVRGAVRTPGGARRLDVVEITAIDGKRRLALIRRDDVEHLVLLGATSELVIETDIKKPSGPNTEGAASK